MLTDFTYALEEKAHESAIELLNSKAFGPARFTRAAFFIREGGGHDPALSFVGFYGPEIVGSVRQTPVSVGKTPALLLGPLVVSAAHKGVGLGAGLMKCALDAAQQEGYGLVLLVGDLPYYERFGFRGTVAGQITMPAPVNPQRLLAHELVPGALKHVGGPVRHWAVVRHKTT